MGKRVAAARRNNGSSSTSKMPWRSSSYRGRRLSVECYECGGPHLRPNCPRLHRRGGPSSAKRRKRGAAWEEEHKLPELKEMCRARGLRTSGRKEELAQRLQEFFDGEARKKKRRAATGAPTIAAIAAHAPPSASAPSSARATAAAPASDVSALFDVDDDDVPVAKAPPTSHITVSQSAPLVSQISTLSQSSTTSSASLPSSHIMSSSKASSTSRASSLSSTNSIATPAASTAFHPITPSLSSLSQTSQSSTQIMTEEQKERMRRSREEAHRRKRARLASAPAGNGHCNCKAAVVSNPYYKQKKALQPSNPYNPYSQRQPTKVSDDGAPDTSVVREIGGKLSKLPRLPPDAPPVRESTRKKLSKQQLDVILMARPPATSASTTGTVPERAAEKADRPPTDEDWMWHGDEKDREAGHPMVRVNAAAGTGKTTTLVHLAARCLDLGHEALTYVTYSRASARDAQERMEHYLDEGGHRHRVTAGTLHSCAMRLLGEEEAGHDGARGDGALLGEEAFKDLIRERWGDALREYVAPAVRHARAKARRDGDGDTIEGNAIEPMEKEKMLFDLALQYLFKTVENFTRKDFTLEELSGGKDEEGRTSWRRHYYPVRAKRGSVFHEGGEAAELGFPPEIYTLERSYTFFADTAAEIWQFVVESGIRTFNAEVKKAQLKKLRIPCSALLVDESQDLDECQVTWITQQQKFGTHIFFVGDAAQSIYGFRGAKASNVMKLECVDTKLSQSWRFGPEIATVANIPLFAKEKSKQTTLNFGSQRVWIPYRVEGARKDEAGEVTTKSLLEHWRDYKQVCLIGNTNAGLMIRALDLLGVGAWKVNDEEDASGGRHDGKEMDASIAIDEESIPRFHINGRGDSSGTKKWQQATRQVRHLYELYTSKDESGEWVPMSLPQSLFYEFADEPVTWPSFNEMCKVKETSRFDMALKIIATYRENTLKAVDRFESRVTTSNCSAEEADIILTTCHSAKGLEWDHVEIADDLYDLAAAAFDDSLPAILRHPSFLAAMPEESEPNASLERSGGDKRKGWQFVLGKREYQDSDINKLYVAMTRARKTLSVPESIKKLLNDFDVMHNLVESFKKEALGAGSKRPVATDESTMLMGESGRRLTKADVWNLYHDLCVPLRKEMGIAANRMILPSLFPECEGESVESEIEREQHETAGKTTANGSVAALFDC